MTGANLRRSNDLRREKLQDGARLRSANAVLRARLRVAGCVRVSRWSCALIYVCRRDESATCRRIVRSKLAFGNSNKSRDSHSLDAERSRDKMAAGRARLRVASLPGTTTRFRWRETLREVMAANG